MAKTIRLCGIKATNPALCTVVTKSIPDDSTDSAQSTGVLFQGILDAHNTYRAAHQAPALAWDDTLAAAAGILAGQCLAQPQAATATRAGANMWYTSAKQRSDEALADALDSAVKAWCVLRYACTHACLFWGRGAGLQAPTRVLSRCDLCSCSCQLAVVQSYAVRHACADKVAVWLCCTAGTPRVPATPTTRLQKPSLQLPISGGASLSLCGNPPHALAVA